MKAIRYSLILIVFLLVFSPADSQTSGIMVTSYYDVNDYHFSSRINRFHRSYAEFTYYSPVFTDTYWYSYTPYSWGVSIYGGGPVYGYSYSYPVYNYGFYDEWYDPYFGYSYYYGYRPVYYRWYAPVVVNRWDYHNHYYYGNSYTARNARNVYNVTNNYYYSTPVSNSRRSSSTYTSGAGIRRESTPVRSSSTGSNVSESRRISSGSGETNTRSSGTRASEGNTRISNNNPGNRDAVINRNGTRNGGNESAQPASSTNRSSAVNTGTRTSVQRSSQEASAPARRSTNSSGSTSSGSSRRK